jgi:glutamyl-tRNA synthetase
VPRFAHLPMILGPDGKRLSKRHGATAVGEYQSLGILPQALNNFLALLGWNPGDDQEIMREHELVARFSIERIGKKSAVFDPEKLEWMNGQHIMITPARDLIPLIGPGLIDRGLTTELEVESRADWLAAVIELLKPRARTVLSLADQMYPFLAPQVEYDSAAVAKHWKDSAAVTERLRKVRAAFDQVSDWSPQTAENALRALAEAEGVGFGKVVHPLRLALTGSHASPGIDQVLGLMGQQLVRQRIDDAIVFLSADEDPELNG